MPVAAAIASVVVSAAAAKKQSDTAKKGMQAQQGENQANRDYIERQTAEARADIDRLYPQVQQYRQGGYQGALQALTGAIPEQYRLFNQGQTMAHSQLLAGMPQFQNAILGDAVDQSAFLTPQQVYQQLQPDFSWLQRIQLPQVQQMEAQKPMPDAISALTGQADPSMLAQQRQDEKFKTAQKLGVVPFMHKKDPVGKLLKKLF